MRLLVDGREVPWPKEIVVEVDGFEEAGPLLVRIVGGVLHLTSTSSQSAFTIQGEMTMDVPSPRTSLILGGGSYDKVARDGIMSGVPQIVGIPAAGSHAVGGIS